MKTHRITDLIPGMRPKKNVQVTFRTTVELHDQVETILQARGTTWVQAFETFMRQLVKENQSVLKAKKE